MITTTEPQIINYCDYLDLFFPDWLSRDYWNHYETQGDHLFAFCQEFNALYYARPREEFSVHEAYDLAIESGSDFVIVEDLS